MRSHTKHCRETEYCVLHSVLLVVILHHIISSILRNGIHRMVTRKEEVSWLLLCQPPFPIPCSTDITVRTSRDDTFNAMLTTILQNIYRTNGIDTEIICSVFVLIKVYRCVGWKQTCQQNDTLHILLGQLFKVLHLIKVKIDIPNTQSIIVLLKTVFTPRHQNFTSLIHKFCYGMNTDKTCCSNYNNHNLYTFNLYFLQIIF